MSPRAVSTYSSILCSCNIRGWKRVWELFGLAPNDILNYNDRLIGRSGPDQKRAAWGNIERSRQRRSFSLRTSLVTVALKRRTNSRYRIRWHARGVAVTIGLVLLLPCTLHCAELPPEIQIDRLLVQAERESREEEHWSAVYTLQKALRLYQAHDFEIPTDFWFRQASAFHRAGMHEEALDTSSRYLMEAGRDGEHYQAALELLDASEVGLVEVRREQARARAAQERAERAAATERAAREKLASQARIQQESSIDLPRDVMKDGSEAPLMIRLPAGRICFGKENCRMVDVPPFAISKHAVTVEQFGHFARSTRYRTETERRRRVCLYRWPAENREDERNRAWRTAWTSQTDRHPVVCVSIADADRYARWLSDQTGQRYRLPGQAEWDYAFLAGTNVGQVKDMHPSRYPDLFANGDYEKPGFWECAQGDWEDDAVIGAVGSCSASPVGIWFESGNFEELVHTCSIYRNGKSVDGAYESLEGCKAVGSRSYFNGGVRNGLFFLSDRSPTHANVGFRVVRDL